MAIKSGTYWVTWAATNAPASNKVKDLEDSFEQNVKDFIAALESAGATVNVRETKRPAARAYLYHWSWMIGLGKVKASTATAFTGVDITWDHGKDDASRTGAKEMVTGFGLAVPPASELPPNLNSDHIPGKAIDMIISWTGTINLKKKDGTTVAVKYKNVNENTELHAVAASYGVNKRLGDDPHWFG